MYEQGCGAKIDLRIENLVGRQITNVDFIKPDDIDIFFEFEQFRLELTTEYPQLPDLQWMISKLGMPLLALELRRGLCIRPDHEDEHFVQDRFFDHPQQAE